MEASHPRPLARRAVAAVALCLAACGGGAPDAHAGGTAMEFLKVGIGAKAAGMGDAFVALADDASASYWNPAGVAGQDGRQALFTHSEWLSDIRLENASLAWGDERQGLGFSATILHVGGLEERDESGAYLGEFRFFDYAFGLSYARAVAPGTRIGVTGKLLMEQIDRERASTLAADLGMLLEVPGTSLTLGGALTNLGSGLKFDAVSEDLPTTLALGASYQLPGLLPWMAGMTFAADVRKARGSDASLKLGWEMGLGGVARYRLGYATAMDTQDIGTGFGIDFADYHLDYAFVPMSSDLGDTHRFSLAWGF